MAPSKRKQRAIDDFYQALAAGTKHCPVHEHDGQDWRRCPHQTETTDPCPTHGATAA